MKATDMENKPQRSLSSEARGTLTGSGLDLETKILSASGRGGTFFLTSLFIELIEHELGASSIFRCKNDAPQPFRTTNELSCPELHLPMGQIISAKIGSDAFDTKASLLMPKSSLFLAQSSIQQMLGERP
jgi:hypothetical protein